MKYFKSFLVFVSFTLGIAEVYAQTEYNVIKPSVNAQQFISATSGENSLQTGQLSINIPLFNLQGKGINVPISISFNGGNITHESEASNIGLGWSLLAGGVIAQTVRDLNDFSSTNSVPWQYQHNYLQSKWSEEEYDIYDLNKFDMAMEKVIGNDGEPDVFKYSFLGYSGDICFTDNDDGSTSGILYPDKSFRIEKTAEGYKIIANDGVEYFFEATEQTGYSGSNYSNGWFLTEVKTLQGGNVVFHYVDDCTYSPRIDSNSPYYSRSKRLTRIDYDYGYLTLSSGYRYDNHWSDEEKQSRRITNIELYNNEGSLIKGYQLGNNAYFLSPGPDNYSWLYKRLKLDGIREYDQNGEYLPPYEFEYDYKLELSKNSSGSGPPHTPINTWAHNPTALASMDRSISYGYLDPWIKWECYTTPSGQQCIPNVFGYNTTVDPIDGYTISDYLCLTKIKFPTGGSESYYYERHDYGFISTSIDTIKPPYSTQHNRIMGKRLWKKEITDGRGNTQIVEYEYCLHDEDYNQIDDNYALGPRLISSGILVNPAIHTSTMYKPASDYDRHRLAASPYYTWRPQNSMSGSSVYYTEVEEILVSESGGINGKKIYYFDRMFATPADNYVYLNYDPYGSSRKNKLIGLPNTLYGKQQYPSDEPELSGLSNQNFTYLAYPVGQFYISDLNKGILLKEVTLKANGNIVRKIVNEYSSGGGIERYGLVVRKFDDNNYNANPHPAWIRNRYLISQTMIRFGVRRLLESTTTHYYPSGALAEKQTFRYTYLNLLRSSSITQSNNVNITKEIAYPTDIVFRTESGLSEQASSIKEMIDLNMIGIPIQTTVKKGTEYIGGHYTTYKQLSNGAIVVDTIFSLGNDLGASISKPIVNTNGEVERNSNFIPQKSYLSYDENGNPTTIAAKDRITETVLWGYGGQYPIAKIENYTYEQLESNSALLYQLALLDDYTEITDSDRASLLNCNQVIRSSLPDNVMITTYTYEPNVGMTSSTDAKGVTSFYEYDSFNRLSVIKDHNGHILQQYDFHYASGQ